MMAMMQKERKRQKTQSRDTLYSHTFSDLLLPVLHPKLETPKISTTS
jgi:hypothetical protein